MDGAANVVSGVALNCRNFDKYRNTPIDAFSSDFVEILTVFIVVQSYCCGRCSNRSCKGKDVSNSRIDAGVAYSQSVGEGRIGHTLADSMPHWSAPTAPSSDAPNVLVILLDDLGYSDFGCFGGEIETPHVDQLAANGLRFGNYTTVPMCTPARAALLTGKNPHSVGCGWLTHSDPGYPGYKGEMSKDAPTMAELLRSQGYATYAAGKWHNTYDANARPGGDMSSWPLQRGFDRFYGFLGAETSYFHPDRMMEGNEPATVDTFPPDYFAPDDYTTRAISWLKEHHSSSPDKPFFLYLAFQSPHTPLQAKPEDLAHNKGRYDAGWDETRRARYERQKATGLIDERYGFAPRNTGVPDWDSLSNEQKILFSRHMEVYASLINNADQNIGRVVEFLETSGALENTIILITSDNGANSIGGPEGVVNLQGKRSGLSDDPALVKRLLVSDRIGSEVTYSAYPSGWAQVSNTPFRLYKRTPMAGGIRVPLLVHWPRKIKAPSDIRQQWIHVTDLLPTVLDIVGMSYPETFQGLRTRPMDGASFANMLNDADAPQKRDRQYYELQANRGYISGRWKIVSLQAPRQPMQLDNWMLFDIDADPAELTDLAKLYPDKVRKLSAEFEQAATANYVYPLVNRDDLRAIAVPPHELASLNKRREFLPGSRWIPSTVISPMIADRDFSLAASFKWSDGDQGTIFSIGDPFCGMSLFVMDEKLHFVYQWWFSPIELAPVHLIAGEQRFEMEYSTAGGRQGSGRFLLNGQEISHGINLSPTMVRIPSGGMTVGMSRRMPVSNRCSGLGEFIYTGQVNSVVITPGSQAPGTSLVIDEAAVQEAMRLSKEAASSDT